MPRISSQMEDLTHDNVSHEVAASQEPSHETAAASVTTPASASLSIQQGHTNCAAGKQPRDVKEEAPSSPVSNGRYTVYPSHRFASTSDEEEDELEDEDDEPLPDLPISQPAKTAASEANDAGEYDDEGSENTNSETSENEVVASQLITAQNTPQRSSELFLDRLHGRPIENGPATIVHGLAKSILGYSPPASPRTHCLPKASPMSTVQPAAASASTPPLLRQSTVPTSKEPRLHDGQLFYTWKAVLVAVSDALKVPKGELIARLARPSVDGNTADVRAAQEILHLVCPDSDCGARVGVVNAAVRGISELCEITECSTRHAKHCVYALQRPKLRDPGAVPEHTGRHTTGRISEAGNAHTGATGSSKSASASGPTAAPNKRNAVDPALEAMLRQTEDWATFFLPATLMPPRKRLDAIRRGVWAEGVCCKACIAVIQKRERRLQSPLVAALDRLTMGESTRADIEMLSKLPECAQHMSGLASSMRNSVLMCSVLLVIWQGWLCPP